MDSSHCPNIETAPETRKAWEEPRIILERPLLVSAQDGRPGKDSSLPFKPREINPGGPIIGPMGVSGGSGECL